MEKVSESKILGKKQEEKPNAFDVEDIVKIKPIVEIEKNLGLSRELDGCLFTSQMENWCGSEAKIIKIVRNYFDEQSMKMFRVKSPMYILEGVICSGEVRSFQMRCDHSCHFIWHEQWLEKSNGG